MSEIAAIVDRHRGTRGDLIAILEEIQARYAYLPEDTLREVAERTGRSLVDIYGVATFYRWFSLKPRGKHLVNCCMGTACHVRGAPRVLEELQRELKTPAGETTPDREFTLDTQACLGACALGPIVVADGHYFSNVSARDAGRIVQRTREGLDTVDVHGDPGVFPVEAGCGRCNHPLMNPDNLIDGHPSIRVMVSFGDHHGWLGLSSLYGSHKIESEFSIPEGSVAEFFCPHCNAQLVGGGPCVDCGAPMVPMIVRGGGVLQICSRRGCRAHSLDLAGAQA